MKPVRREKVITHWLEVETGEKFDDLNEGERLNRLFSRNPDAGLVFVDHDHDRYRGEIDVETLN